MGDRYNSNTGYLFLTQYIEIISVMSLGMNYAEILKEPFNYAPHSPTLVATQIPLFRNVLSYD